MMSSKNYSVDYEDTEGIKSLMVKTLTLDPKVKSNSLPFVLECCECNCIFFVLPIADPLTDALWVSKMMFQPLRIVTVGREYVLRHYARSDSARRKLTLVSNFAIARDTTRIGDDLPSFGTFRSIMFHDYTTATSNTTAGTTQTTNSQNTSCFFDYSYEVSVFYLYLTHAYLANLVAIYVVQGTSNIGYIVYDATCCAHISPRLLRSSPCARTPSKPTSEFRCQPAVLLHSWCAFERHHKQTNVFPVQRWFYSPFPRVKAPYYKFSWYPVVIRDSGPTSRYFSPDKRYTGGFGNMLRSETYSGIGVWDWTLWVANRRIFR